MRQIECSECSVTVGYLEEKSRLKPGLKFICHKCYEALKKPIKYDVPDFMRDFWGGAGK